MIRHKDPETNHVESEICRLMCITRDDAEPIFEKVWEMSVLRAQWWAEGAETIYLRYLSRTLAKVQAGQGLTIN